MIIEIDNDKVLWSYGTNLTIDESWNRANTEELIKVYETQKHGKWIKTIGENGVTDAVCCSICGFEDNRYELFNYCPRCGAKMDEVEE